MLVLKESLIFFQIETLTSNLLTLTRFFFNFYFNFFFNCLNLNTFRMQTCPDRPRRIVPKSRPSQMESAFVATFVRSPDFRAFMSRLSCVHFRSGQTCFRLGPQPGFAADEIYRMCILKHSRPITD